MSLLRDLIFAVSTIPALSQVINIRFNEFNNPYIPNVLVPDLTVFDRGEGYEPIVNARLHLDHRSVLAVGLNDFPDHSFDGVQLPTSLPLLDHFVLQTSQRGHLIDTHGPITILRNTSSSNRDGILILNNTFGLEQFNESCSPGSLARIPFVLDDRWPTDVTLHANWPSTGRQITGITSDHPTYIDFSWNADFSWGIFDLPRSIANQIYEIIANSGAALAHGIISNCSMESFINDLPDVQISFPRMNSTIIVFPEDYILFDPRTNICDLNFIREDGAAWRFDPLALPNVNVHVVGNDLFICDAI
jgi:hypothetical protein